MSFLVAANWKMNKSPGETRAFFSEFLKHRISKSFQLVFFVSPVNGEATAFALGAGSSNPSSEIKTSMSWGPQNIYHKASGAFTGETSPRVMKELGAQYVLVGHSERRTLFGETNEQVKFKVKAAMDFGMSPVVCVGEALAERRQGRTLEVLKAQLQEALEGLKPQKELHIAYEPVWAIGTGEVASPEQVAEAHGFIRKFLEDRFGFHHRDMKILYGGSVKADNACLLKSIEEVGGFLVGGASLEVNSFLEMIRAIEG